MRYVSTDKKNVRSRERLALKADTLTAIYEAII
jgi:hypothetical protein